jgi:hypothetical protein
MFDDFGQQLVVFFIFVIVVAMSVGGAAVWLLPKLWHWLKPIIHNFTA